MVLPSLGGQAEHMDELNTACVGWLRSLGSCSSLMHVGTENPGSMLNAAS